MLGHRAGSRALAHFVSAQLVIMQQVKSFGHKGTFPLNQKQ
jgi:hypothetical protein